MTCCLYEVTLKLLLLYNVPSYFHLWYVGFQPQRSTLSTASQVSPRAAAPPPRPTLAHVPTAPSFSATSPVDVPPRRAHSGSEEAAHLRQSLSEPGTATLSQMSLYSKHTGRNQAVRTELKPDVWKLAYLGVKKLTEQVRCNL